MAPRTQKIFCRVAILTSLFATSAIATELKPETAAAFDRYVRAMEARMDHDLGDDKFFVIDTFNDARRAEIYTQLKTGQPYIESLRARENDHPIHIPSGLIHHWCGVIFIPNATIDQVIAVLQDYDHQQDIYKPQVRRSKLIERHADETAVYVEFYNKSIVEVFLNTNFRVTETRYGPHRYQAVSRSTRVAEVENPDTPNERERPVGNDHGYMWRLNTYWRIEEKDGGVYVQNESVSLSRTVPPMLAFIVNPLIKNIPRNVMLHLLTDTRTEVVKPQSTPESHDAR